MPASRRSTHPSASLSAGEPPARPLIIGHRGACGHRPDHTLASYELAAAQGADFVEPDLVMTKDRVLICRHDCDLGPSTDVAFRFPDRKRAMVLDGQRVEGWFAEDFTLAEVKTLRARQPLEFRDRSFDGHFEVPTFEEFLEQARTLRQSRPALGIIPELKHSTHHAAQGLEMEGPLLALLEKFGYRDAESPCVIQSFEVSNLKTLSRRTKVRLLQLIGASKSRPADVEATAGRTTYGDMMTRDGLKTIAGYAWGVGPAKDSILPVDQQRRLQTPNSWIEDAHGAGLKVLVFTFRNEPRYLAVDYGGDPAAECRQWARLGVDGFFTDFPDTAVAALNRSP